MVRKQAHFNTHRCARSLRTQSTISASQIEESQLQFGYGDAPGGPPADADTRCACGPDVRGATCVADARVLAADCAVTGLACACLRVTRPYSACFWADALPTRLTLTNKAVRVTLTRPHGFLVSLRTPNIAGTSYVPQQVHSQQIQQELLMLNAYASPVLFERERRLFWLTSRPGFGLLPAALPRVVRIL